MVQSFYEGDQYLVFNLDGRLLVVKYFLEHRVAEIRNLVKMSGFGMMSVKYTMFYAWNWA